MGVSLDSLLSKEWPHNSRIPDLEFWNYTCFANLEFWISGSIRLCKSGVLETSGLLGFKDSGSLEFLQCRSLK